MAYARAAIVPQPIEPAALSAEVSGPSRGAICSFVGTVRDRHQGRQVTGLDYECYEPMAAIELREIVTEAQQRFADPTSVAEHRTGSLAVGDIAVAVFVAHERRASAIGAMEYVIEELKRRLPVWKLEHYADGERSWVNAVGDRRGVAAGVVE